MDFFSLYLKGDSQQKERNYVGKSEIVFCSYMHILYP